MANDGSATNEIAPAISGIPKGHVRIVEVNPTTHQVKRIRDYLDSQENEAVALAQDWNSNNSPLPTAIRLVFRDNGDLVPMEGMLHRYTKEELAELRESEDLED